MVISASRRTDIPLYYTDWFLNRLTEGYALVRNPINPLQVRRVSLTPEDVDCIVFWTKDPRPLLPHLQRLHPYPFYFQFTLTAYGADMEPRFADKASLAEAFLRLSDAVGPERVLWRYDPVLLSPRYTPEFHAERFYKIANRLSGCTIGCTVSFLDHYRHTAAAEKALCIADIPPETQWALARLLSPIARDAGIMLAACAEPLDLLEYGIGRARCIDPDLVSKLSGHTVRLKKDKSQRPECGCAESADIGVYQSCPALCRYCYANHSEALVKKSRGGYDVSSPMLCDKPAEGETIPEAEQKSRQIPMHLE